MFLGDLWAADEHAGQGLGKGLGQGLGQGLAKRALSAPTAMAVTAVHLPSTHDTAGVQGQGGGRGKGRGVRFSDYDDDHVDDIDVNDDFKINHNTDYGKNKHNQYDRDDDNGLGSRQPSRQLIDGPFEPRQPHIPRPDRQLRFNTAPTPSQPTTSTASASVPAPNPDPVPGPSSRTGSAPAPGPSPDPGDALVAELRALRLEVECSHSLL